MIVKLPRNNQSGFTLAELLVSVLLMSLVLTAAYTAFSSSIRLWKLGEANLETYQDARTGIGMLTRELQCFVPGAAHLIEGDNSEFAFYAVTPPMHPGSGDTSRVLWVRYRLRNDADHKGRTLVREERVVEDPLPSKPPAEGQIDRTRVSLGVRRTFDIAYGVKDLTFTYYWQPPETADEAAEVTDSGRPPEPTVFVMTDDLREGEGMPQGIGIDITLFDENADSGEVHFKNFVAVGGDTTFHEDGVLGDDVVLMP